MIRTRFLAAALLTLPLAACEVDNSQLPEGAPKSEAADSLGDVQAALAALPSAQVVGSNEDGVPFMIKGSLDNSSGLQGIAAAFRLNATDLVMKRTTVDEQGNTHIRYGQTKNGLPVIGGELLIHKDSSGKIFSANGSARDGEVVPAVARISGEAARASALDNTVGRHIASEGEARLVYIRSEKDNRLKLAYHVVVTGEGADLPIRDNVYVNALTGQVEATHSEIHSAKNRAVYSANNGTSLPGTLKRSEGGAATGDTHVDDNYNHLGTTYDCYSVNFGRDSYNGSGAQLRSTVHYSTSYTNAFWNGTQMVYGDSNGVDAAPLGKSLDVTVHELTHAVTSSESNLTYANESGALNEGLSDIFGAYCESWNRGWVVDAAVWMVGDDVWTPATPGDALRYMANPTQDGSSKDYYPTRYTGTSDNGGVHWNSGIANLAFVLLTQGGTHPRGVTTTAVTGIGIQKAGQIFYRANRDLMTASTTFAQAKTYTEQAATALGYTTAEVASVSNAWIAVGVGLPPPPATALTNNVGLTGQSGASGSQKFYYLDVPASRASTFTITGGTGDADLYVKIGSQPTTSSYNCRPYLSGNTETCNIAAQTSAQRIHVLLNAYSTYSGVTVKGAYTP
ncbi:M4 family metallopeptidase [Archangium lansingense]|uniref:Neutral metalloproteinase n=1 Tax=Archangium lansingense TaxID=2995310 RepID=A0ABT4ADT5_9BACT|nr:M4 family metallopeptidase [Archangium lansinium]MCY1079089.1 M4 family metallopeptidase [Archangium lansinium]